jgi:ComF family protein
MHRVYCHTMSSSLFSPLLTRFLRKRLHPWSERLVNRLHHHIPSQCAVCKSWPSNGMVCELCVTRFAQPIRRCTGCALALKSGISPDITRCGACIVKPPPLDECLASVSYDYPWNHCIASYKFGNDPAWASTFALLLKSTPWIEPALDHADILIPVPLSTARLQHRGYNQALELCKHLNHDKTDARLLLRIKDTLTQSTLSRSERLQNVKAAFAVEPLRAQELQGKRVVLVDDVMTSGVTLFAAASALRQAGAGHITAIVFARTEAE